MKTYKEILHELCNDSNKPLGFYYFKYGLLFMVVHKIWASPIYHFEIEGKYRTEAFCRLHCKLLTELYYPDSKIEEHKINN